MEFKKRRSLKSILRRHNGWCQLQYPSQKPACPNLSLFSRCIENNFLIIDYYRYNSLDQNIDIIFVPRFVSVIHHKKPLVHHKKPLQNLFSFSRYTYKRFWLIIDFWSIYSFDQIFDYPLIRLDHSRCPSQKTACQNLSSFLRYRPWQTHTSTQSLRLISKVSPRLCIATPKSYYPGMT